MQTSNICISLYALGLIVIWSPSNNPAQRTEKTGDTEGLAIRHFVLLAGVKYMHNCRIQKQMVGTGSEDRVQVCRTELLGIMVCKEKGTWEDIYRWTDIKKF
jgi:hypothetical protein